MKPNELKIKLYWTTTNLCNSNIMLILQDYLIKSNSWCNCVHGKHCTFYTAKKAEALPDFTPYLLPCPTVYSLCAIYCSLSYWILNGKCVHYVVPSKKSHKGVKMQCEKHSSTFWYKSHNWILCNWSTAASFVQCRLPLAILGTWEHRRLMVFWEDIHQSDRSPAAKKPMRKCWFALLDGWISVVVVTVKLNNKKSMKSSDSRLKTQVNIGIDSFILIYFFMFLWSASLQPAVSFQGLPQAQAHQDEAVFQGTNLTNWGGGWHDLQDTLLPRGKQGT